MIYITHDYIVRQTKNLPFYWYKMLITPCLLITELAERSPRAGKKMRAPLLGLAKSIYYKMVVVSPKNMDSWPFGRPYKVLLLTCVVICTAGTPTPRFCPVVQWSVHWAPSRTIWVLVLAGARRCALETFFQWSSSSTYATVGFCSQE